MLRLRDTRTGSVVEIVPSTPGVLKVCACGSDLRTFLLADLISRTASMLGLQVRLVQRLTDDRAAEDVLDRELSLLNVAVSAMSLDLLGPVIDIHTGGTDAHLPHHELVRQWVHAEPDELGDRGVDPLALRLALLGAHYRQPADLTAESLAGAQQTLARWRTLVATGAESPSAPIDPTVKAGVLEAFTDDLDTPHALQLLHAFEASDAAPGCVFETFAWADRLLGLDLARDVGRAPA